MAATKQRQEHKAENTEQEPGAERPWASSGKTRDQGRISGAQRQPAQPKVSVPVQSTEREKEVSAV